MFCSHLPAYRLQQLALVAILLAAIRQSNGQSNVGYYGQYIGPLSRLNHGVSGEVYAVDARTLHIRDFTYDGQGPAAFFYAGNTKAVGPGGFFIRDENGSNGVLKGYKKKHITVTLPEGKTLNNIRWFSVWCEEFAVNFGDVQIPRGVEFPKPQKISPLSGVHAVSSEPVVIVDAQTLLIPSFSYDGEAPDAKFWVGRGPKPSPQGIRVPDENGKQTPLRRYDRKTIVLTLPGDLTVFDIGHFGVWCEAFTVDFGHVQVPPSLNVPPSLKMLGVSPQSKLNCEVLSDELAYEVRWAVAGDSIVIQLVAKLEDGEYMSFGLSGEAERSAMVGGDVVVAWVDQASLNGFAQDYYLDAKSQCAGAHGSCPDTRIENNSESVRLLNAALVNGYSIVTYQRPLRAHDSLDKPIVTNKSQPVIWAVGPLNGKKEVSYHSITSKGDIFIDFGRPPKWNCPIPQTDVSADSSSTHEDTVTAAEARKPQAQQKQQEVVPSNHRGPPAPAPASPKGAWEIPPIQCNEPDDGVFYAQMGPTGGKHGYPAITGHVGWGIAYYINGLLIPEIHVVRGKTYNFVVEGGSENDIPAKFHPFYITDDPVGGYMHKTPEERRKVNIYAGAELNKKGEVYPTGIGRLCNWTPDPEQPADDFGSFGAYQRTLTLICDRGEPGVVQWTPDRNTPDTVYYQCFSHRYLGWKIHVHDSCDLPTVAGSDPVPSVVLPEDELQAKPSIQVTTRVKPDFPPQSIGNEGKHQLPTKQHFPYEFMKPPAEPMGANSTEAHVKPVKEEYEDLPENTPSKQSNHGNSSTVMIQHPAGPKPNFQMKHPGNMGGNPPMRVPYGNLRPPPSRRPTQVVMVRRPAQGQTIMMKPQMNVPHFPHMNVQGMPHMNVQGMPHMNVQGMPHMNPQGMPIMNGQGMPHMNPPMLHHSASQPRPVIIKKPIMKHPQRPPMVQVRPAPTVVLNSQGPVNRPKVVPVKQANTPKPVLYDPKPFDTKPAFESKPVYAPKPSYTQKFKKTPPGISLFDKSKNKMHPSQMISSNHEELTTKMPIAVNTGFNPGSLVIESGFKPIINAPPMAEERVSEVEYDDEDNNEGVINMDSASAEEQKSQTEMFEPMFIPSPLDSNAKHTKKSTTEPVKKVRKPIRQVIMRRPIYEEPLFRSEPDDEEDEEAMANEKMETIYDGKLPPLTYDGKKVDGVAPPVPPPPKTETRGSEILKHTPQFGPFKGEIPPPVPKKVPADFPQLSQPSRPIALALKSAEISSSNSTEEAAGNTTTEREEEVEVVTAQVVEETTEKRSRRSAHHEPGHTDPAPEPEPTASHSEHSEHAHEHAQSTPEPRNGAHDHLASASLLLVLLSSILSILRRQ